MGSPETRVSGERGSKAKYGLGQEHTCTAISNTPVQNFRDSIREQTLSTIAVVRLTPKPKLPTPVIVEVLTALLTGH